MFVCIQGDLYDTFYYTGSNTLTSVHAQWRNVKGTEQENEWQELAKQQEETEKSRKDTAEYRKALLNDHVKNIHTSVSLVLNIILCHIMHYCGVVQEHP